MGSAFDNSELGRKAVSCTLSVAGPLHDRPAPARTRAIARKAKILRGPKSIAASMDCASPVTADVTSPAGSLPAANRTAARAVVSVQFRPGRLAVEVSDVKSAERLRQIGRA